MMTRGDACRTPPGAGGSGSSGGGQGRVMTRSDACRTPPGAGGSGSRGGGRGRVMTTGSCGSSLGWKPCRSEFFGATRLLLLLAWLRTAKINQVF